VYEFVGFFVDPRFWLHPNHKWNQIANLGRKLDKENYNIQGLNMKEEEGDALTQHNCNNIQGLGTKEKEFSV
jgi:hypothetical protein